MITTIGISWKSWYRNMHNTRGYWVYHCWLALFFASRDAFNQRWYAKFQSAVARQRVEIFDQIFLWKKTSPRGTYIPKIGSLRLVNKKRYEICGRRKNIRNHYLEISSWAEIGPIPMRSVTYFITLQPPPEKRCQKNWVTYVIHCHPSPDRPSHLKIIPSQTLYPESRNLSKNDKAGNGWLRP